MRDPESKTLPSGNQVCSFAVASNRFYRQGEELEKEVSFFEVEAWSKLGQSCAETLKRGRGVRVVGRLKQDRWNDTAGNPHTRIKIVAEHVEFKPVFKDREGAPAREAEARRETSPAF